MVADLEARFERDAERWKALARPTPEWFRRAKLGFFIHWGPYSVPAWGEPVAELGEIPPTQWFRHNPYAEWYHNTIRLEGSPAQRHHAEVHGGCDYDDFLDSWRAERFDADAAVAELVAAGGSYVMITTKHHDGVCLWDAPGTGDRNTVRRGPGRDLVGEWADAARRAGMRFGAYYSGGLDWHAAPTEPIGLRDDWDLTERPLDQGYASYAAGHLRDLIARYNPDVLWNDINWPDAGKDFGPDGVGTVFEEYYVANPEGLVNDRWQVPHQDYATSEYKHLQQCENAAVWEHCRGVGLSFGYNSVEGPEHAMTPLELMKHLVDIVWRGGRMLLAVGDSPRHRALDAGRGQVAARSRRRRRTGGRGRLDAAGSRRGFPPAVHRRRCPRRHPGRETADPGVGFPGGRDPDLRRGPPRPGGRGTDLSVRACSAAETTSDLGYSPIQPVAVPGKRFQQL